jgi:hypothetical protein
VRQPLLTELLVVRRRLRWARDQCQRTEEEEVLVCRVHLNLGVEAGVLVLALLEVARRLTHLGLQAVAVQQVKRSFHLVLQVSQVVVAQPQMVLQVSHKAATIRIPFI